MLKKILVATTYAMALSMASLAHPASALLDPTFNSTSIEPGTVATTIDLNPAGFGQGVTLQPDGKIVVAGSSSNGSQQFAVARFTTDGILDSSFNAAGDQPGTISVPADNGSNSGAFSIVLQPDGNIVVAGYTITDAGTLFAVARFTPDGTLDTTFNMSGALPGTVSTTIDNSDNSQAFAVALQEDGKIVAVGFEGDVEQHIAAARFNSDGTLDTTFNAGGVQPGTMSTTVDSQNGLGMGKGVAVQTDGKIVITGFVSLVSRFTRVALVRLLPDGTLDSSFNSIGSQPGTIAVTIDNNTQSSEGNGVVINSDGTIIVVGDTGNDSGNDLTAVARFTTDGTLDTTFNATGAQPGTVAFFIDTLQATGTSVAIDAQQNIVVGGTATSLSNVSLFAVARLTSNGALDATFNPTGIQPGTTSTSIAGSTVEAEGNAIVLQADGKIILAGTAIPDSEVNTLLSVARFINTLQPPAVTSMTTNPCALRLIAKYGALVMVKY